MVPIAEVSCVFLCVGQSSRMTGAPLITAATEVKKARFSEIVAVTGFEAPAIAEELGKVFSSDDTRVKTVHNPDFKFGIHASIRTALKQLTNDSGFIAICLADQPPLLAADYDFLIAAAQENPRAKLISTTLKQEILGRADADNGCAYLFEIYRNATIHVSMPTPVIEIEKAL